MPPIRDPGGDQALGRGGDLAAGRAGGAHHVRGALDPGDAAEHLAERREVVLALVLVLLGDALTLEPGAEGLLGLLEAAGARAEEDGHPVGAPAGHRRVDLGLDLPEGGQPEPGEAGVVGRILARQRGQIPRIRPHDRLHGDLERRRPEAGSPGVEGVQHGARVTS